MGVVRVDECAGDEVVVELHDGMGTLDVQFLLSWYFEHVEPGEVESTVGDLPPT